MCKIRISTTAASGIKLREGCKLWHNRGSRCKLAKSWGSLRSLGLKQNYCTHMFEVPSKDLESLDWDVSDTDVWNKNAAVRTERSLLTTTAIWKVRGASSCTNQPTTVNWNKPLLQVKWVLASNKWQINPHHHLIWIYDVTASSQDLFPTAREDQRVIC